MAEESISLSESEYRFLKSLVDHQIPFLIVGLSAALLQGIPAVTQDIDLWIDNLGSAEFLLAVKEAGAIYIPPGVAGQNPPLLAGQEFRGIDLITSCSGLGSVRDELIGAREVAFRDIHLRVLPLDRIILSKESANREKDRASLPMLKAAAAVLGGK